MQPYQNQPIDWSQIDQIGETIRQGRQNQAWQNLYDPNAWKATVTPGSGPTQGSPLPFDFMSIFSQAFNNPSQGGGAAPFDPRAWQNNVMAGKFNPDDRANRGKNLIALGKLWGR